MRTNTMNSPYVLLLMMMICLVLTPVIISHGDIELVTSQCGVDNQLESSQFTCSAKQPYRTAFHFQPSKNWMNDPNGPMFYKGIYHLFYQHNPNGAVWLSSISWAHSTSTDLVNWIPHPMPIFPSEPYDINGCCSGSTTILPGNEPAILYTGIDSNNDQVQNLAVPKNLSDPYLIEWVKSPHNPLMAPNSINKINGQAFRDPTTAWLGDDGKWRIIIGIEKDQTGIALLFTSEDFVHWTEAKHSLHSTENTGMWECVDFYPVATNSDRGLDTSETGSGIKHVLKSSMYDVAHDYYIIGTYNTEKDIFTPDEDFKVDHSGLRLDHGKFYASKTFFDSSTNRRIIWAWVNESTDSNTDIMKGWSGVQAIPRTIWLDESGERLMQWPVEEIEQLRTNEVNLLDKLLTEGSVIEVAGVTGIQADVEVSFSITEFDKAEVLDPSWTNPEMLCSQKGASVKGGIGPFGLMVLASKDIEEYTAVFFRVFKNENKYVVLMCSDQSKSSLHLDYDKPTFGAFLNVDPVKEELSLRILVDNSIVESFGGDGKACITARVYPTLAIDNEAHLYAFNNGTESIKIKKLSAWSMNKAQIS